MGRHREMSALQAALDDARSGRMGNPSDIGDAVALLCAEGAGWITGQVIHADGGASLMDPVLPPEMQAG